jgi:exo-1,4-beta-D-glucosaminidase
MTRVMCTALLLTIAPAFLGAATPGPVQERLLLKDGWFIAPSTEVAEKGAALSTPAYESKGWYKATMPATVLAALTADHIYADPYFGMNLRAIPGTTYPIGEEFSNLPMPPGSPFRSSWWYRTEFTAPAEASGRHFQLHFEGINFRANVWFNGKQIAADDKMAGAWRVFEFDVTGALLPGKANALAVEVFPPGPNDLGITFVDWNPAPPDKGMGIWRDVYLTASGPATLRYPQVVTRLDMPGLAKARLTVTADVHNTTDQPVRGVLKGQIESIQFSQPVSLEARETKVVAFSPEAFAQLNVEYPRLWWPVQTGQPNLYPLQLELEVDGAVSDRLTMRFGIREISSELVSAAATVSAVNSEEVGKSHRVYSVNGKRILVKGAGWTFDMMLRANPERQQAELQYVRDMNLNAVRLEGKVEDDNFLRLTDEMGILVFAGWCCCDHWEHWKNWTREDHQIAAESLRDQIRRIRSHPSLASWMNGSDNPPPPDVEKKYLGVLQELHWPNPVVSSATARPTTVTGDSGVKMTGPYEYVAPSYWLLDRQHGGAHGFNTETSPGPAVPPVESLRKMLPEEHLWPIDSWWNFHAGGGVFRDIHVFTNALSERYGKPANVKDYSRKAQAMTYEGERAMFEAFERNKYTSTGVIQWMLNNAWPSMIWHLYDYYLRPGGGYFGTKTACEPLHILYSYDDDSVAVVNSHFESFRGLKASAKVFNLDMSEKFSREATFDLASDGVAKLFTIPQLQGLSTTYFVRLSLEDAARQVVSSNFYWLSTKQDAHDWEHSTWYYTPQKSFADLRGLETLPPVELRASAAGEVKDDNRSVRLTVENPSASLAFQVHLKMESAGKTGDEGATETEILPVLWSDNYFALMPGEKREITATYAKALAGTGASRVVVDGWNVKPLTVVEAR